MTEVEEQIIQEARPKLPIELRFAIDDPSRVKVSLENSVLTLEVDSGFIYSRFQKPEVAKTIREAAEKISGEEITIKLVGESEVVKPATQFRVTGPVVAEVSDLDWEEYMEAVGTFIDHVPKSPPKLDFSKLNAISKPAEPDPKPGKKFVDYFEWMKSPEWRVIRNRKLKESGYICELCGSAKNLHVHHITYENIGHEPMDDLLVVCNKCHKKLHEEDFKKKGGH